MRSKPSSRSIDALLSLDLIPALSSGECPVCHVLRQRLHRYIAWFLIETYHAPPLLDRLADSRGFCPGHFRDIVSRMPSWQTWQMSFVTEVLVRHYLALIRAVRRELSRSWYFLPPRRSSLWRRLLPRKECPLCSHFRSWEAWTADGLAWLFADSRWTPTATSAAVCVPHLWHLCRFATGHKSDARAKALRDLETAATASDGDPGGPWLGRFLCGDPLPPATEARPPFLRELVEGVRSTRRRRPRAENREHQRDAPSRLEGWPFCGCLVCLLSQDASAAFLASARARRRPERLCRKHLCALLDGTHEPPLARGQLNGLIQGLSQLFGNGSIPEDVPYTCPVCDAARMAEGRAAAWLAAGAGPDRETPARAGMICLRHLPGVVRLASPAAAALILEREEVELREVSRLLAEYHRKRDYRYKDEPAGEEQGAWRRALKVLAGPNKMWQAGSEGGKDG
jgi:hypothetical protein